MKNILILSSNSHSLYSYRSELLQAFLAQGFSVIAAAPQDAQWARLIEKFEPLGIKVVPLKIHNTNMNVFADLQTIFYLIKIIKSYKINYVFSYHMKPVIYGSFVAYGLGIRHIYAMITGLGYAFTGQKTLLQQALTKLLTLTLKLNKKVFFQNADDYALICQHKKLKKSAVLINGSGVDINFFKFTLPPQALSFLFVGRLLIHKGIYEYIEAVRALKSKYPHISFKVAGGRHSNPSSLSDTELRSIIQERLIDYLGEVQDILPVLQEASVCVLPSYREGCPRAVLEALSVGRPIITTHAPGCKDTVVEGQNGYLVPVKDASSLAKAMETFIKIPSLVNAMGKKSRQLAEEKYDVQKVNAVILNTMNL